MRPHANIASITFIALLILSAHRAQAVVISGTNITFGPPPLPEFPDATHRARVIQALNGDYTDTWFKFTPAASTLVVINHNVDESSDWYLVPAGAPFTTASIASGQFAPLVVGNTFYPPVQVPSGNFYLGVNTGIGFGEHNRDVFGWIQIHNDGQTLQAVDNAVAYGELGIYIGTTIAVPEPATSLVMIALIALVWGEIMRTHPRRVFARKVRMPLVGRARSHDTHFPRVIHSITA